MVRRRWTGTAALKEKEEDGGEVHKKGEFERGEGK